MQIAWKEWSLFRDRGLILRKLNIARGDRRYLPNVVVRPLKIKAYITLSPALC